MKITFDMLEKMSRAELRELKEKIVVIMRQVDHEKFKVGSKVMFNYDTRPQYLQGRNAVIIAMGRSKAKVRISGPIGRFRDIINAPYSLLDPIPTKK
jgi:superfamily I DNA and RNA helicase